MQILPFSDLFAPPAVQARFRRDSARGPGISVIARELAGLAGLLGWLGVLFYLTATFAARLT